MKLLKVYLEICRRVPGYSTFGVLLSGMAGMLEGLALLVLIPVLNQRLGVNLEQGHSLLDKLIARISANGDPLLSALVVFLLLGVAAATVRFLAEASLLRVRMAVDVHARTGMTEALVRMNWTQFLFLRTGDISKSIIIEGTQMASGTQLFLQALGAGLAAIAYLVIAAAISLEMTFYTLLFASLAGGGYVFATRLMARHADSLSRFVTNIGDQVNDIFSNLKFFRSTGRSFAAEAQAKHLYLEYAGIFFRSQIFGPGMRLLIEAAALLFISGFLWVSFYLNHGGVAEALVFLAVFYRLAPRLLALQDGLFKARTYLSWYWSWQDRLAKALQYAEPIPARAIAPTFTRSLEFRQVEFSFPLTREPVLTGVDLLLRPGECLAIVGPSGSGKSTIIDLLTGLLRLESGSLLLDGYPLEDIDLDAWRHKIGLVMQDNPVLHATVQENIAWGDDAPDYERVREAAKLADALDFIQELPQQFDTLLGERGARLSGGQRQRIALARALYRNPWLLILDEATSSLDGESELRIQRTLEKLKGRFAILMVAHRLKTVEMADRIAVLENGKVVETGNWDDLLNRQGGRFRRMAQLQGLITGAEGFASDSESRNR